MSERHAILLDTMRAAGSVGDRARVAALEQLQGGWSRHSYVATVEDPEQRGAREVVVRVHPKGSLLDTSLEQEFRIYRRLEPEPLPTPGVHGYEPADETPFGGPFFVMDRLPGASVNVWRRRDRERLQSDWDGPRGLATDLVTYLAAIHAVPAASVSAFVAPRSFRENVLHWRGVWEEARLVRDPIVEETYAWVLDRDPGPVEPRLVHSDYRIGNCLVADERISGVLDWELSFVGDARFDLGYMALDYSGGKFVTPGSPLLNAVAERDWFYERYSELTGLPVDREVVKTFAAVGGLMLFAILCTGVHVYATEQTRDIRMAWGRFTLPGLRQDFARLMGWTDWR